MMFLIRSEKPTQSQLLSVLLQLWSRETADRQAYLEGLALALATPDAENQRDLDLRQVHEVLGHVDGELVQERWADVEAVL
jgi:hypothetical protein